jgi:hypothetical protein
MTRNASSSSLNTIVSYYPGGSYVVVPSLQTGILVISGVVPWNRGVYTLLLAIGSAYKIIHAVSVSLTDLTANVEYEVEISKSVGISRVVIARLPFKSDSASNMVSFIFPIPIILYPSDILWARGADSMGGQSCRIKLIAEVVE